MEFEWLLTYLEVGLPLGMALVLGWAAYTVYRHGLWSHFKRDCQLYLMKQLADYLRLQARPAAALSEATLDRGHLRVEFVYRDNTYQIFLPLERRGGRSKSATELHLPQGEVITINHPPGVKFPTTASALGLDKIVRYSPAGRPTEYTGETPVA